MRLVFTAAVLLATLSANATEPTRIVGASEPIAWYDGQLVAAGDGERPFDSVHVLMATLGDRVDRVYVERLGIAGIDPSGLRVDANGRITGTLQIGHEPRRMNRTLVPKLSTRMPLRIELVVENGTLGGRFEGEWPHPKSIEKRVPVAGEITGHLRTHLAKSNGLPKDATWPSWLGPSQNFSSGDFDAPLVADLNDARLVWVSDWIGPTESGSQRYGACVGCPPAAGGASPLVANGRVYQFRTRASGEAVQQLHLDKVLAGEKGDETRAKMKAIGWTMDDLRERWAIRADEELLCLDAATGKTLWTARWPGKGINLYDHKCSLTNHTGVLHDGRVFVFGAMGRVRCVDGETGQMHWQAELPGYSDFMDGFLEQCLERKNVHAPTRSFCHGLTVSGTAIIAPDGVSGCGLVALDSRTGKLLWHVKDRVLGKAATPLAWRSGDTDFVIAADAGGRITCIDAQTGDHAWQIDDAGDNEYTPLLVGDLLIAHDMTKEEREKAPMIDDGGPHSAPGSNFGQVACWKLSANGAERVWTAPAEWGAPSNCPIGSTANGLVCFRGQFSYYLVDPQTGRRVASRHLPEPVRWDEGHMLALPDTFVLHPDSQHGVTKMFPLPARADGEVGPMWLPPHPPATTYQSAMSHAWADGRLFIRGADALYCYDLRAE